MIKRIKHFIRIAILCAHTRVLNIIYRAPKVVDDLTTLKILKNEGKSISRLGDGEIALIKQQDIKFQKMNIELGQRMQEVLENPKEGLLVGIPDIYTLKSIRKLTFESKLFWLHQLIDHRDLWYSIPKDRQYYDACITRPYIRNKDKKHSEKMFEGLKEIWHNRDVVIVEGAYSRLGVGNDLFQNVRTLRRIICPPKDAYEKYDEILRAAMTVEKGCLFLLSLGPTATVLAYDLHEAGCQAIDLGHIDLEYEWYLRGVQARVPLDNKSVNELDVQGDLDDEPDGEYEKQIIDRVV